MYRKSTKILSPLIFLLCFVFVFTACSGKEKLSEMSGEKLVKLIEDYGIALHGDYDISKIRDVIVKYENDPDNELWLGVSYTVQADFLKDMHSFVDDYYK